MSYTQVPARDRYDLANAYRSLLYRIRERKKEQAEIVAARLLGKSRCHGCKAFIDKSHTYCDDCIPF